MTREDLIRKATRTKLWAAVGGGGSGLAVINEGVDLVATSEAAGILTILGGVILTAASVVGYLVIEGNIDKARESVKALVVGRVMEDEEPEGD